MSEVMRKYLYLAAIFLAGIVAGGYVWDGIFLPFSNPDEVVGPLTLIEFNSANNIVRFLSFVSLPALFLIVFTYFRRELLYTPKQVKLGNADRSAVFIAVTGAFLICLGLFLRFFTFECEKPVLDIFHEGENLTPAYNYLQTHGIWTKSLIVHGAFYDLFETLLAWKIFGVVSIGADRILRSFLDSLTPFSALFFIGCCFIVVKRDRGVASAVFLFSLLLIFYVAAPILCTAVAKSLGFLEIRKTEVFYQRDILYFLGLGFLLLASTRFHPLYALMVGLWFPLIHFYSIDRSVYYFALTITAIALYLLDCLRESSKQTQKFRIIIIFIILGWSLGWALFLYSVGYIEFKAMLANTYHWIRYKELIDGLMYPNPMDVYRRLGLFRSSPLLMAFFLFFTVYRLKFFLAVNNRNITAVWTTFLFSSLFYYRYALGRSDIEHVQLGSGFIFLTTAIFLWIVFIDSKVIQRTAVLKYTQKLVAVVILVIGCATITTTLLAGPNLWTAKRQIEKIVNRQDISFLAKQDQIVYEYLNKELDHDPSIYIYPSAPAWYYLLRIDSPTKYISTWHASPVDSQRHIIRAFLFNPTDYILWSSDTWYNSIDGIPNSERVSVLNVWIEDHYEYHAKVAGSIIGRLKTHRR